MNLTLVGLSLLISIAATEILFRLIYHVGFNQLAFSYDLNSLEFRDAEPDIHADRSVKNRIMLLGDSYTYGYGVDYPSIYPVLLEDRYSEYSRTPAEVLNFSRMGWNPRAAVEFFKKTGVKYDFDTLILSLTFNDIEKEALTVKNQRLSCALFQMTMFHTVLFKLYELKQYLLYGGSDYNATLIRLYRDKQSPEWRQFTEDISFLNDYCLRNNKKFIIFFFEIYCRDEASMRFVAHEETARFAREANIPFISIPPRTDCDLSSYQLYHFDSHPNALGHQLAADALIEYFNAVIQKE